jgi:hypothetical protein
MAESAMAGLFQTPEMYQQARLQQQQEEAARYAQMDPMQRATYGTYMAGQQLGSGIGQLFGVQDPQLRMISQQQRILGQIDPNDPESIAKGAQMAAQMGNNNLASALATRAREAGAALALIQQRTAEKQTPEQRNAEAMSALQERITRITDLPENTPGREAALKSFTSQLENLQSLTAKTPPAQIKEITLAKAAAALTGFPEGSPQYNTAYVEAFNRLAYGEDKAAARFGVEREAIAMELYNKPFASLTQTEIAAVNKRAEASAERRGTVKVENIIPGVKEVKDVPGLRSAIIATVKPFREIVNTTDQALQAVDDSIKEGNYISFNAARSQLAKALSGSDVSYKEIKGAGGDPSILGGLLDATSTMFTGTPSVDTQLKIKKTLQAMRSVALKKGTAEIEAQRTLAQRSGFNKEDFTAASNIPEFNAPVVGGGKTRTLSSGKVVTVID